jgi:hypothetical protein
MKRKNLLLSVLVISALSAMLAFQPQKTDISGKWILTLNLNIGTYNPVLVLKQDNDTLITGTYSGFFGEIPLKGTLKGNEFVIDVPIQEPEKMTLNGTVDDEMIKGKVTYTVSTLGEGTFTGKKDTSK